MEETVMWT